MKKIVVIGANSFQNPLILKAKEMGFETHVFAWQDGSIGERTADYFYPISIVNKEQIFEKCREIQPDAVTTIASDLANITAQYVAKRLGLPCNSDECIKVSTNKYAMRGALKEGGLTTPKYVKVASADEFIELTEKMRFPMIVKPTDRSGSRSITKVESVTEASSAIERAVRDSFEKRAIVEEYIEGEEFSCECISYQGEHSVLAVTKKYTTGYPHFIETGHIEPAMLSENILEKIKTEIPRALDAMKIQMGASHPEFKIDNNGDIHIIEIGSRMGGDCIGSHLVQLSSGQDFTRMVIETALGQKPTFAMRGRTKCAGIRFVFSQEDIDILNWIRQKKPELLQFVSEMEPIGESRIVDSASRLGYFILAGDSKEEIRELVER